MDLRQDLAFALMPAVREAAREAGQIACSYFRRGGKTTARVWSKHGGSPVTEADVAVDSFLKVRLIEALPDAAWLSEETTDDPARLGAPRLWIVDPIDGTRAFLSGHPDWSIAIALLVDGEPVLGIVHAPAHGLLYEACRGGGAFRESAAISASARTELAGARVAGPKPLIDRLQRTAGPLHAVERIPSLALRLVRVAEGAVDLGLVSAELPRLGSCCRRHHPRRSRRPALDLRGRAAALQPARAGPWRAPRRARRVASAAYRGHDGLKSPKGQGRRRAPSREHSTMTETKPKKQLPHLVFGGEIEDLAGTAFRDLSKLDIVGIFPDYASAHSAWKAKAQATVDNAHMRYFIVHLHRLLDPGAA